MNTDEYAEPFTCDSFMDDLLWAIGIVVSVFLAAAVILLPLYFGVLS